MKFYTQSHDFYCGIDLHARSMYLCIRDRDGKIVLRHNMASAPELFLEAISPYRGNLVVSVECIFWWYWLADLCAAEKIEFVLGHVVVEVDVRDDRRAQRVIAVELSTVVNNAVPANRTRPRCVRSLTSGSASFITAGRPISRTTIYLNALKRRGSTLLAFIAQADPKLA
jgi:hypothetical protein